MTVIDARHVAEQLHNEQAREQVAFADVILINKIDLVSERSIQALARLLRSFNPLAKMHQTTGCDIDLGHVVGVRAFDLRNALKLDPELLTLDMWLDKYAKKFPCSPSLRRPDPPS